MDYFTSFLNTGINVDQNKMKGFKNSLGSKYISVLGAGKSGKAATLALRKKGAKVLLSDKGNIKWNRRDIQKEEFGHTSRIFTTDMVVLSPSVIIHSPFIQRLITSRIPVISELELGYRLTEGYYIAITGTNGKTTTTSLLNLMIPGSIKAGNIGIPLSTYADRKGIFVLEVSSFQLMTIDTFKPDIAAILNIEEDHLDWHKDMKEYIDAKARIFENQTDTDILVLNFDDKHTLPLSKRAKGKVFFVSIQQKVKGAFYENGTLFLNIDQPVKIIDEQEMLLRGFHNVYNALFASLCAYLYTKDIKQIRKVLREFRGLPHRIEYLGEIKGIKFFNDSKGTNPHAVLWALKGFKENVILVLGGEDKGLSFRLLREEIKDKVKFIIAIGATKERILEELGDIKEVKFARDTDEVVELALLYGRKGDTLLFSPGCSSFDMFKNYKERGNAFRRSFQKKAQ